MVSNERGIALIITLLVVALLAITVVEFSYSVEVDQRMARNALNSLQAALLARSGINLGEALLLRDDVNRNPQLDAFTEDWCPSAGPEAQSCDIDESNSQIVLPENMRLRVRIFDEGSKFNVNMTNPRTTQQLQLWSSNPNNPTPLTAFDRLCAARGVDAEVSNALMNYWSTAIAAADQAVGAQPNGSAGGAAVPTAVPGAAPAAAQSSAAIQQQRNQILAQYEFKSLDDLGVIPGMTPSAINHLRPVMTAFPTLSAGPRAQLNVNTVPRAVLDAVLGDDDAADNVISARQSAPLPNAQLAQASAKPGTRVPMAFGVVSQIFLIRASAIINADPVSGRGGVRRSASMLVQRSAVASTTTSGSNTGAGGRHWTLTQLDWQKEAGAALFKTEGEGMPDDASSSMGRDAGGMTN